MSYIHHPEDTRRNPPVTEYYPLSLREEIRRYTNMLRDQPAGDTWKTVVAFNAQWAMVHRVTGQICERQASGEPGKDISWNDDPESLERFRDELKRAVESQYKEAADLAAIEDRHREAVFQMRRVFSDMFGDCDKII